MLETIHVVDFQPEIWIMQRIFKKIYFESKTQATLSASWRSCLQRDASLAAPFRGPRHIVRPGKRHFASCASTLVSARRRRTKMCIVPTVWGEFKLYSDSDLHIFTKKHLTSHL